jgi:RNA polymerase sigma-70 factor (ECF subfamily)
MDIQDDTNDPARDAGELIMHALRSLEPEARALMVLYLEEYSYQDISETLGISVSYVGVRINRIKKKLKEILSVEHG